LVATLVSHPRKPLDQPGEQLPMSKASNTSGWGGPHPKPDRKNAFDL